MCSQLFLLLPQRCLLLPPDSPTTEYHHDRLVPCLFSIRRTTRRLLLLLSLERTVPFTALAAFFDGRNTVCIVCFGLFARAKDVVLGYERVRRAVVSGGLFGGLEGGKFAFGLGTAAVFDFLCRGFDTEIVEQCEIGGCQNLSQVSIPVVMITRSSPW